MNSIQITSLILGILLITKVIIFRKLDKKITSKAGKKKVAKLKDIVDFLILWALATLCLMQIVV